MLSITEIKDKTQEIIENLKKLTKEEQEYVNGYVQGLTDAADQPEKSAS